MYLFCVLLCNYVCVLLRTATLCLCFGNVFVSCCVTVFVSFFSPQHCVFFLWGPCVSVSVGEGCLALSRGSEIIIDQYHLNYHHQSSLFDPPKACNQSSKNDWNSRWPCHWWPFNGDLDGGCPSLSFYYAEWQTALTDSISATAPPILHHRCNAGPIFSYSELTKGFAGILVLKKSKFDKYQQTLYCQMSFIKKRYQMKIFISAHKIANFDNI